jgi:hypothetical protein
MIRWPKSVGAAKRLSYREQEDQECVAKLFDDDHRELARDTKGETVCIKRVSLS